MSMTDKQTLPRRRLYIALTEKMADEMRAAVHPDDIVEVVKTLPKTAKYKNGKLQPPKAKRYGKAKKR